MELQARQPGKKLYVLVLAMMLLGVIATLLAGPLTAAFPPVRGARFGQVLLVLLVIREVTNPIPATLAAHLPSLFVAAFFWFQVAIVARRVLLCVRNRGLVVPVALTGGWKVLLLIGVLSWILGTAVFLSPLLLHVLSANEAVWAMQIANTFFTGLLFIPAANVFGISFFVVEILSAGREGWLPRRIAAVPVVPPTSETQGRIQKEALVRRAGAVGLIAGIALLIVPPLWSLFPTGLVFERLCKVRAGEHVYQTVNAKSYVLIGEGAGEEGFHLDNALEDVTSHRVDYIEVVKDRRNGQQANSFISLLGTHDPPGVAFRVSLGPSDSPDCVRRRRPMYGTQLRLDANQCLRFTPIDAATSRYRVEAVDDEHATWYTPHILAYGVRVVDGERRVTLGEHMRFARAGLLPFFVVREKNLSCPPSVRFRPITVHRKVLLGEK